MDKPRSPQVEASCRRSVALGDKGEGDRTRRDWLASHVEHFTRRAATEGFAFDESTPAVFERFTLVWLASDADPEGVYSWARATPVARLLRCRCTA